MSKSTASVSNAKMHRKHRVNERSARKAIFVTLLCAAVVLAGTLSTLLGLRFVIRNDRTWAVSDYQGFSEEIEIPDTRWGLPVTEIAGHTFFLDDIVSVELGKNVTELGGYAFYGCTQLKSVSLNYGLESIGSFCFGECTSLKRLVIPSTVTFIHDSAFNSCPNLTIVAPADSYAAQYALERSLNLEYTVETSAVDSQ